MSGVQVDNSPAVAIRSLDISSWKEVDISALTSSEKKRYYRRKSAIKDYYTTEDPLDEIATRYHLPMKMLEKLVKRCLMQHEDGAPWGYRALVPGVTAVDHTPPSEPEQEPAPIAEAIHEDAEASAIRDSVENATIYDSASSETMHESAENATIQDDGVDVIRDGTDNATIQDVGEADVIRDAAENDTIQDVLEADVIRGDVDNHAIQNMGDDSVQNVGEADVIRDGTNDDSGQDIGEADVIRGDASDITATDTATLDTATSDTITSNSVASDITASDTATPDPATPASTTPEITASDSFMPVSSNDATLADDDEDTAQRRAIMLEQKSPSPADEMSDIIGIEETAAENQVEDNVVVESVVDILDAEPNVRVNTHTPLADVSRGDSGAFYLPELANKTSRSLVVRERMLPAALPRTSKKHIAITGKKAVIANRSIRRRWVRSVERMRKRSMYRLISAVVVAVLFLTLLIPVGAGLAAYSAYNSIKGVALDGVSHLLHVKTLLPVSKNDLTSVLNPEKLQQANADFTQAESDFLQLQTLINRQDVQSLVQQLAPQYSSKLGMAQRLVQVGIDVTRMGSEFMGIAMLGANVLHGSPLAAGSTKPLITTSDVATIEGTMLHALFYIQDIKTQMSQVTLNQLPISVTQQKEIASAITLLPKAQNYIEQGQGVIGIVSWLLGVGHARRFLVQTMDRAELRPSGGFTGQYGVFTIQDGRMAPFTLQDVTELDYNGNGAELNRPAPPGYTSWMNFGNFGLRDANLSGDFPTTARLAMQVFQDEGGGPVDGDIMFTPTTVEHILDIIGPLKIPAYNETITAQNLEDKLHFYQNDPGAIALQKEKTGTHNAATRKSFTALVGSTLLSTVRRLPVKTLLKVVQNAVKDIQSRDLEIYFNNPLAEGWLVTHSFSGAMNTFSNVDGFMVVQSNISISKASTDVQTTEQDNITLDAQGGATHNLMITLDYRGTKPIYSVYTTYADYIRVYAPANAVLQGGDGFDTGKALCTPAPVRTTGTGGLGPVKPPSPNPGGILSLPSCGQFIKTYTSNTLYCPNGNYDMGQRGWVQGKGYTNWSIDMPGAPSELTSDLPGRAMWGGLTVTPKNCTSTISLTWYVPNVVKHVVGQPLYSVLVQKQGGYVPLVQISIDTSQLSGVKPYSFNGNIYNDRLFSLAMVKKGH